VSNWKFLGVDNEILNYVKGYKLPFFTTPVQNHLPCQSLFSVLENQAISRCIHNYLESGALVSVNPYKNQFISPIFVVPKPDSSYRLIINLKRLNEFLDNQRFKMEDYRTVRTLLRKDSYMSKIDLQDAYHSVPIHKDFRKYLRFSWNN
jgi:reverse transcriptase-like protein